MVESAIASITSVGVGFFVGIIVGYFIKKAIKIVALLASGIVVLLLYLQQQQIISVNQESLEASITLVLTTLSLSFDKINLNGDMSSLGIPLTTSMTAGFMMAVMKG